MAAEPEITNVDELPDVPGVGIFLDVFRRADKNDDDKISREEFHSYFSDGVVSQSDLDQLFAHIDDDGNGNIDTRELCNYFLKGYEPYAAMYEALESMNSAVNASLRDTAKVYSGMDFAEQFRTRFYLKEALLQLESLMMPIDRAVDHLEEETRKSAQTIPFQEEIQQVVVDKRVKSARRNHRSSSLASEVHHSGGSASLDTQIARLAGLLDKFEAQVNFNMVEEEGEMHSPDLVVVRRTFVTQKDTGAAFRDAARGYLEEARRERGCCHLYMRQTAPGHSTMYEIWEDNESLAGHYFGEPWRAFQRACADVLAAPSTYTTMEIPNSWWPHNGILN